MIITDDCISCGMCIEQCPFEAIEFKDNKNGYSQAQINQDKCRNCKKCLTFDCPGDAFKEGK